jgi:hypothetical protein
MYTLLVTGDVPGASTYFNPLLQQSIVPCTSGTRPTGVTNMVIFETDTLCYRRYNGSSWVRIGAFDVENAGTAGATDSTNLSSITGTSFAAGSPACGTSFVAPPSGGVFITVSGHLKQVNNANNIILGWEVRTGASVGAGTITVAGSSVRALVAGNAVNASAPVELTASRRCRLQAGTLTAGSTYNVQTLHLVSGGAGAIDYREIIVEPVL